MAAPTGKDENSEDKNLEKKVSEAGRAEKKTEKEIEIESAKVKRETEELKEQQAKLEKLKAERSKLEELKEKLQQEKDGVHVPVKTRGKKQIYILIGVLVLFVILIALAGLTTGNNKSTGGNGTSTGTLINCNGVNLNFNYSASQNATTAPAGTNTFNVIYITNTGNTTENISLAVSSHSSLKILVAASFSAPIGQKSYTEYEIASPQIVGNYTANVTLTSRYDNCVLSKSFIANIIVTKSSTNSS